MAKSTIKNTINIRLGQNIVLRKAAAGVDLARLQGERELIQIYSLPPLRTGRHYEGNPNTSSAPGESPAPQTGELRQGVASTPPELRGSTVSSVIASRSRKAKDLELGTERIDPRPAVIRLRTDGDILGRIRRAFNIGAERA